MINSALLLCLGWCKELCRAEVLGSGYWVLGGMTPWNPQKLCLREVGCRLLADPTGSDLSAQTLPRPGNVCVPPFLQLQKLLPPAQGGITSQPPNGQEHQRHAQDSSSMARGHRAELGWDSASSSCRARLPLPLCPSYRHWHSRPLHGLGMALSQINNTAP